MERSLADYAAGHASRRAAQDAADAAWRAALREPLERVADDLVDRFGARRVVLFGSHARGEARPGSDVDLLVEGLPLERLLEATAHAARRLGCDVDLVPIERARAEIVGRAVTEGVVLRG